MKKNKCLKYIILLILIIIFLLKNNITYLMNRYIFYKNIKLKYKKGKKNILLISNSRENYLGLEFLSKKEYYFNHCFGVVEKFLNSFKPGEVLLIHYAGSGVKTHKAKKNYNIIYNSVFKKLNINLKTIDNLSNNEIKNEIINAECIFISGGNTFKLLKKLKNNNLFEILKEKINNGTPYIGVSSGCVILNDDLKSSNSLPIVKPTFQGLDVLPFIINVHYKGKHIRLIQYLIKNKDKKIICIPDGSIIHIVDNDYELAGFGYSKIIYYKNEKSLVVENIKDGNMIKEICNLKI